MVRDYSFEKFKYIIYAPVCKLTIKKQKGGNTHVYR